MARQFTGQETIECAAGSLAGTTNRTGTIVVLVRPFDSEFNALATNSDWITGRAGTTPTWALFMSSSSPFSYEDFSAGGQPMTDKNTWYAVASTKQSGTPFRYHVRILGSGAWDHRDGGTSIDGSSGTDNVLFGVGPIIGQSSRFEIVSAARFVDPMSDAEIEAAITDDMADWMAAGPLAAWQFNQPSTSDPVTDLTGGGANQTAISGTTVVSDPAGWTYYTPPSGDMELLAAPGLAAPHGAPAVLARGLAIAAAPSLALPTGLPAALTRGQAIAVAPAAAGPHGAPAALTRGQAITAQPATAAVYGAPAALAEVRGMTALPPLLGVAGVPATLIYHHTLTARPGQAIAAGAPAQLSLDAGHLDAAPAMVAAAGAPARLLGALIPAAALTPGGDATATLAAGGDATATLTAS